MTRLLPIVLAAVGIYVCLGDGMEIKKKCGSNEELDTCPVDCPSDNCTKSECEEKILCPKPKNKKKCAAPKCKCGFNYRRADNGTCIPVEDCPAFECGDNEEYDACPPLCSDDCLRATKDGERHVVGSMGIRKPCKPACRCEKYYWRKNGTCVSYEQCRH